MNKSSSDKHEFAIYTQIPEYSKIGSELQFKDDETYHRIVRVLRLEKNENVILFDRNKNLNCTILDFDKKNILLKVLQINLNKQLEPNITVFLPILKREAFEEAIYYCVELGANIIQPIITQKVHIKKIDEVRINKILIAAAEQSKNFNFSVVKNPIDIKTINFSDVKIFLDAQGQNCKDVLNEVNKQKVKDLSLMFGPEGDLTQEEKEFIKKSGFIFCALTPTILRAQTAVAVALGIFRSNIN